ncbi:MAG: hypothetical protein U0V54_07110 [Saprospiraceae bacterium]
MTYCLEGSCSIQLSYETDIFCDGHFLSEGDLFWFEVSCLHSDWDGWIRIYLSNDS